jgi:hypothetical protein
MVCPNRSYSRAFVPINDAKQKKANWLERMGQLVGTSMP